MRAGIISVVLSTRWTAPAQADRSGFIRVKAPRRRGVPIDLPSFSVAPLCAFDQAGQRLADRALCVIDGR